MTETRNKYNEILENLPEERKEEIKQKYLDIDPETLIVTRKNGMSFFEKLREDKKSRALASRQMGEIYVVMLEAQKEAIVQKCTLGLDIKKKSLFLQYLDAAENKNQQMYNMSADIDSALNNLFDQKVNQIDDMEANRLAELESRHAEGKISDKKLKVRMSDVTARADQQVNRLEERLEKLQEAHSLVYDQATDILRKRVIDAEAVL